MDESSTQTADEILTGEEVAASIADQRRRAEKFLGAQRAELDVIEAELLAHLAEITQELAAAQAQDEEDPEELRRRGEDLAVRTESLTQFKDSLLEQHSRWLEAQQQAAASQQALAEKLIAHQASEETRREEIDKAHRAVLAAQAQLVENERSLAASEAELEQQQRALTAAQAKFAEEQESVAVSQAELDEQRQSIAASQAELEEQRRSLVASQAELQEQNRTLAASQTKLLESRQAFIASQTDLADHRTRFEAQWSEWRRQEKDRQTDESAAIATLVAERDEKDHQLRQANGKIAELAAEIESLATADHQGALAAEIENLTQQRDELTEKLAATEAHAEPHANADTAQEAQNLERRFEMAVADVREYKRRNAELEEELERLRAADGSPNAETSDSGFDWESQKQAMLAALDSDFDTSNKQDRTDRLTLEGTIRITDDIVAEKDREIAELKQALEQRPAAGSAEATAAATESIDMDELLKEEREKLIRLQDELLETQRKAEVAISLERAKVARERAQLDEKMHEYESRAAREAKEKGESGDRAKPAGGRWLSRLGLADLDDE